MTTDSPTPVKVLWKFLVPLLVILTLVVGSLVLVKSRLSKNSPAEHVTIQLGTKLPDIELTRLDGSKAHLSELGGQVFLINFWASWCEACLVEMPSINELRAKFHSRGLEVLGINLDENPESVVPKLQKQLSMEFPIFVDTDGKAGELFDVHAIPFTVIIDNDRTVLEIHGGERDWVGADIVALMDRWLKP